MKTTAQGKRDKARARGSFAGGADGGSGAGASDSACPFLLPFVIVLGFGLFRGVNSNAYLSAFASVEKPFLFVPDLFFNVVVAIAVAITSAVVVVLVLRGRAPAFSMPILPPTLLLLFAKLCALFNVFSVLPSDLALLVPGLLFGIASVMLSLVWIETLAAQRPTAIVTQIALSMLVNMIASWWLSTLTGSVQLIASCVLLAIMASLAFYVRRLLKAQSGFSHAENGQVLNASNAVSGVQGEEAAALNSGSARAAKLARRPSRKPYRGAFLELGDSLIAYCVLEAVIGLLNSFMIAGSIEFAGSGSVSIAGTLIGIVAFSIVVFVVQRMPKISTVFRALMPMLASLLVFLPFLGEVYNLFFSTVLLGSYYFIALIITYVIAETSHTRQVSPYVLMAVAMGLSRICLAIALSGGYAIGSFPANVFGESEHVMRYLVIIVAVIYALSVAAVLVSRDRKRKRKGGGEAPEGFSRDAYEYAFVESDNAFLAGGAPVAGESESAAVDDDQAFGSRCARIAERCGLTDREGEILGYLARGRTNVYIAGVLFVSENTVRSHVRNIYSKLDVHTRQQLIDLVEAETDADHRVDA